MHAAGIEPHEERFFVTVRSVDEVDRGLEELLVDRLHAFLCERSRVLASLLAPWTEAGIVAGSIRGSRDALKDAARTELSPEGRVLRIVRVFGLVLGVQMVKVAEEL